MDPDVSQKLSDLVARSQAERKRSFARRPKRVADVVADVVAKHGYAAVRGADRLRDVWRRVADRVLGDGPIVAMTSANGVRRGVLEVTVVSHVVLQEMTFHRPQLLTAAQEEIPEAKLSAIRFKVGRVDTN